MKNVINSGNYNYNSAHSFFGKDFKNVNLIRRGIYISEGSAYPHLGEGPTLFAAGAGISCVTFQGNVVAERPWTPSDMTPQRSKCD